MSKPSAEGPAPRLSAPAPGAPLKENLLLRRPARMPSIRARMLVLPVLAIAALSPTATAQASCAPTVVGVAASGGRATSDLAVCAPAWGRPAGSDTGRKVG